VAPPNGEPVPDPTGDVVPDTVSPVPSDSVPADGSVAPEQTTSTVAPEPAQVDELVLTDDFSGERPTWGDSTWDVDIPGEASATVIDGVGVMETDLRGTHEWVRALAPGSTHEDAELLARITPVRSNEGTVFLGLHGDGEWRDASPYLPQTGVVVEYSYSPIFEGEFVLIVLDGPDERRSTPVVGPVLDDGDSATIRFVVVDGRARVKIWRTGDEEPAGWAIEGDTASTDGGVVQIAYRDGVGQSVAWDELTLRLFP
jgi:hypothetical protein